jgi:3-hydroxyacyl-[acyl-carrier-protein] dehydratase
MAAHQGAGALAGVPITMPPSMLVDLDSIDLSQVVYTRDEIYSRLPQAYEFSQLDAVVYADMDEAVAVAARDVKEGEWWCRGHIPGRPIYPGILHLESAAQLAALFTKYVHGFDGFVAFGGVDKCKFRDSVTPPARIYYVCKKLEAKRRRIICACQALVNGAVIFEAVITGLIVTDFGARKPTGQAASSTS